MEIFIFWLFFSIIAGVIASNKGRSGFGFFLLSVILSPLIGIVCAVVAKSNIQSAQTPSPKTHVKCPHCAEWVLPEASVCKHCDLALTPDNAFVDRHKNKAEAENNKNLMIGIAFIAGLILITWMINFFVSTPPETAKMAPAPAPSSPLATSIAQATPTTEDGMELAKKSGCLGCHDISRLIIGPSFISVAKKYKGVKDAEASLISKVLKGGPAVWGSLPMPPMSNVVNDADIKTLIRFVLGLANETPDSQQTGFTENQSLKLSKGTIRVGMTSDDFILIVPASAIVNQVVKPDPASPGSLVVRKDCRVDGKEFTVILARENDPGPYVIIGILTR